MTDPQLLQNVFWALTTLLEVILLSVLLRKGLPRVYPAFFIYVLSAILQSAIVAASYHYFGSRSAVSFNIAWGSQGAVVVARWFAVIEIARKTLTTFPGIWKMASRILFVLSMGVLFYSIASSRSRWTLIVLNADRAAELCIAAFIVGLFFFVRYYRVPMPHLARMLAIGFCLYSCFGVINDSIYESWRLSFAAMWNYLDMLTFLASLFLWIGAARKYSAVMIPAAEPVLTPERYGELSQKLNSRLHLLNDRLDHLSRSGSSGS